MPSQPQSQSIASTRPLAQKPPDILPPSPAMDLDSNGISAPQSLAQAVKARRLEYIRKKTIMIKVGTWNTASIHGTEKDLGPWFVGGKGVKGLSEEYAGLTTEGSSAAEFQQPEIESVTKQEERMENKQATIPLDDVPALPNGADIGLYVLGLQEVVDVSSASEALKPYTDPNPGKKWKAALEGALPKSYVKIAEQQLLGLLILIYASADVASSVSSVSTTSVGTGLMGYLGNKGAVSARIVLGDTTRLVFVNCHLAAGADAASLNRRNWDLSQILSRTKFAPITDDDIAEDVVETIGDEDFGFWFGDLNYRMDDIPGDDVRRLLLLHTRNEYDIENKSKRKIDSELGYINADETRSTLKDEEHAGDTMQAVALDAEPDSPADPKMDPASLITTIQSLLAHDQLRAQQKLRKAFHDGWQEGEINFLPTYKYDVGSVGMFDSGEKKRAPSWCDRILFRTRANKLEYDRRAKEDEEARKKDGDMKARGLDYAVSEEDVLFDYNPDEDGLAYGDDYDEHVDTIPHTEAAEIRAGFEDSITLDQYVSHQRVLSSDHKPLDAVFTLTYDAVVPELRARVQQDAARELDKAENEGRPGVTLVVDSYPEESSSADDSIAPKSNNGVHFGQVRFGVAKNRGITVANTSQASTTFGFVDRPVQDGSVGGVAPSWINLHVETGSDQIMTGGAERYELAPGDTANIVITINVSDISTVRRLNEKKEHLDDILVLRVEHGRDHFIPVRGTWMQSCFGRTLDELVQIPEGGIRYERSSSCLEPLSTDSVPAGPTSPSATKPRRRSAPHELFMLTEAIPPLVERSIAEWDMTRGNEPPPWSRNEGSISWPFDSSTWTLESGEARSQLLADVREALDTWKSISEMVSPETSPLILLEAVTETLLSFLKSLPDGIIQESLWTEIEVHQLSDQSSKRRVNVDEDQDSVMEILSQDPVHSVSFTFITFMLARTISELLPQSSAPLGSTASSRASMTSVRSRRSDGEDAITIPSPKSEKSSFFSSLTRRGRATTSLSGPEGEEMPLPDDRRRSLARAYAAIFANIVIRSDKEAGWRGREKRMLDSRRTRVIQLFLSNRTR